MFRLRLLGGASIVGPAGPLTGPATQQRRLAALALLAASPTGGMSRDKLAAFLWPEKDRASAHHRLADTLHGIRKALGKDAVRLRGGELSLDRALVASDVGELEAALARGDFEEAVSLYRGPFLDGFFVKGAPEFERWAESGRGRFARAVAAATEALAGAAEGRGELGTAVRWWRERLALDPLDGRGVLRLMEALAAAGDRAGAAAEAHAHARRLRTELDLPADPAVTAVAERLKEPPPGEGMRPPSIAVLPFANLGAAETDEYIADGITEELIHALSRLPTLRVAARTSSFAFKGQHRDVRDIGHALGVAALLEGGVRRDGRRLRVTARLVDAASARPLWAGRYDRDCDDMLRLQEEIAGAIAGALEIQLPGGAPGIVPPRRAVGAEAHDHYLKGRYFLNTRTKEGMLRALDCFERSVAHEPSYARAHAGLAEAYLILGSANHGVLPPRDALERARRSAERALALDPALVDAHVSLGIASMHSWSWTEARTHLQRAVELDPENAAAHHRFGWLLALGGDLGGARSEVRRATELDPLSLPIRSAAGRVHEFMGDLDEAITCYRGALELDPGFADAYCGLGTAYLKKGLYREAVAALRRADELGRTPGLSALLAFGLAMAGESEEARALVQGVLAETGREGAPAAHIGDVCMALGEIDDGFAWYEAAYEQRSPTLMYLDVDPMWAPMRTDPRWGDLVRRVGLERLRPA